jgi:hypothetical protein
VGGAHRDHKQMAAFLKRALNDAWRQVADLKPNELIERRYERSTATAASPTPRPSKAAQGWPPPANPACRPALRGLGRPR